MHHSGLVTGEPGAIQFTLRMVVLRHFYDHVSNLASRRPDVVGDTKSGGVESSAARGDLDTWARDALEITPLGALRN